MGKGNDDQLKKKYQLYWEYFRRSNLFKKYEKYRSKNKSGKTFPEWLKSNSKGKSDEETFPFSLDRFWFVRFMFFSELIQGKSFDDWWEKSPFVRRLKKLEVSDISKDVESLHKYNSGQHKDFVPEEEKIASGEKQPWETTIDPLHGELILRISGLHFWDIPQLQKEIRKIIRKRKKEIYGLLYPHVINLKLRYDEVERYLKVYKYHVEEKKSYREIAPSVYPNKEFNGDLRIVLVKEKKKAKTIIENVERGIFPGKY